MFRFAVIALLATAVYGQKAQFDKLATTLISDYLETNTPKATDVVAGCLVAQKTWDEITDAMMDNIIKFIPAKKMPSGMAMLSTWDSCMKKAGSSMAQGVKGISAAFAKVLNTPYTNIIKKMKEMAAAKKTEAQMTNQAYTMAAKALTKKLVQTLINTLKKASTKTQWDCSLPPLNVIMLKVPLHA